MDVSIIIVSYNTKELTRNCLRSVFEQTRDIDFEVIVSDNGSTDGSVEMIRAEFPQAILVENNANLGFGAANNRGLKIAKGKYVFYLNSDTVLLNNAVKMFFDYWENSSERERISGLGCVLQEADGTPIHSGGEFPVYTTICKKRLEQFCISLAKFLVLKLHLQKAFAPFLKKRQYAKIPPVKTETGWTDYVTGADLFMLNNVDAMFDERFTLYYEETDMLLRLHKKTGRRCVLLDAPKIIHLLHKGRTDKIHFETFSSFHDKLSAVLYFKKHGYRANFLSLLTKTIISLPPNRIWLPEFKQKVEGQAR